MKPTYVRAPKEPTTEEREEHELTHLPYRAWCKHCVRGRGKSEAHKELHAEQQHTVPHVSMDYCFMGQDESKCLPILVVRDHASRFTFAQVMPMKGTKHVYLFAPSQSRFLYQTVQGLESNQMMVGA